MTKAQRKELKDLMKNEDNKRWVWKQFGKRIAVVAGTVLTVWQLFQGFFAEWPPEIFTRYVPAALVRWSILIILLIVAIIVHRRAKKSILDFTHVMVQTEREGCTVEISMADSYLTNAFVKYPKCAMLIGLNDCFWFREAEPRSLVEDLWGKLKEYHIDKIDVQNLIDEELKHRLESGEDILDEDRPQVLIRRTWTEGKDPESEKGKDFVLRENYKTGTVIGIDLRGYSHPKKKKNLGQIWREAKISQQNYLDYKAELKRLQGEEKAKTTEQKKERKERKNGEAEDKLVLRQVKAEYPSVKKPQTFFQYLFCKKNRMEEDTSKKIDFFKKLYFIANAEVVQGRDTKEPIKVAPDEDRSVVENFENIWKYFELDEEFNVEPPKTTLYAPLLLPLIGGGVANEGYTDIEIFSKLVDLYYEHMRASIRANQVPAVQKLIINIRNNTAIESANSLNGRQIDMNIARTYLEYRNKVNPPVSRDSRKLQ